MKKNQLLIILSSLVICMLFTIVYLWPNQRGAPKLEVNLTPAPPWHTRPGQSFRINMTIKNEGKASAKNVNINFTAPIGFIISESGKNYYIESFAELMGGEIKNQTLTLTISTIITPGNYTVTVIFYAENVPKKSYYYEITVELPYIP